jgi:hypothetical protein
MVVKTWMLPVDDRVIRLASSSFKTTQRWGTDEYLCGYSCMCFLAHGGMAAPVTLGYGDASAPMSLGLHFLGQQLPRGPDGEFECLCCGDAHWYRKCNAPASLEELAGQHARVHASHLWWATSPGHLRLQRPLLCRVWGRRQTRIITRCPTRQVPVRCWRRRCNVVPSKPLHVP